MKETLEYKCKYYVTVTKDWGSAVTKTYTSPKSVRKYLAQFKGMKTRHILCTHEVAGTRSRYELEDGEYTRIHCIQLNYEVYIRLRSNAALGTNIGKFVGDTMYDCARQFREYLSSDGWLRSFSKNNILNYIEYDGKNNVYYVDFRTKFRHLTPNMGC